MLHNNQRFVGGLVWHQIEQTYDGDRLPYQARQNIALDYTYVDNINGIFGLKQCV